MFDIVLGQNDTVEQNVKVCERQCKKIRNMSQRGQNDTVSEGAGVKQIGKISRNGL
jgi:hypothetical protein